MIGDNFVVRLKPLIALLGMIAGVILLHNNLLHVSETTKDTISLVCYILIAFNNPIASKIEERNDE